MIQKFLQKIDFNAPVTLTFAVFAIMTLILNTVMPGQTINNLLCAPNSISPLSLGFYLSLFTHILPHQNWAHFIGNFSFILILGPIIEERYGSKTLLFLILATAGITGLFNALLFSSSIIGASGIVFLLIILASFGGGKENKIPLTFIIVFFIYMGGQIISALKPNCISEFAHLMGGLCGAGFGFWLQKKHRAT